MNNNVNVRKIAYKVLYKVLYEGAYSSLAINSSVHANELNSRDTSFLSSIVYGVLEQKLLLEHILSQYSSRKTETLDDKTYLILLIGLYQLLFMDKIPDNAAVDESVKLSKKVGAFKSSGFINAILRNVVRNDKKYSLPNKNDNFLEYLSVRYSCPKEIVSIWINDYGKDNTIEILKSLFGRPPLTIRVNTLKTSKEKLINDLKSYEIKVTEIPFLDNALNIENTGSIEKIPQYKHGDFYIQDCASQVCCEILNAQSEDCVCDVCAAPGGKSLYCAIKMNNIGEIYSYDIFDHKIKLINDMARRLGITCICAKIRDASDKLENLPECNKLLCDVPCSGLGIIRRKPEIRYKKDTNIDILTKLQYSILCENAQKVSIGSVIVYSTCTLNKKENNNIVKRFLDEHKDFAPEPIVLPKGMERFIYEEENVFTILPFRYNTDGFFVAKFKRVGFYG